VCGLPGKIVCFKPLRSDKGLLKVLLTVLLNVTSFSGIVVERRDDRKNGKRSRNLQKKDFSHHTSTGM
jgi:hypothetical protein